MASQESQHVRNILQLLGKSAQSVDPLNSRDLELCAGIQSIVLG